MNDNLNRQGEDNAAESNKVETLLKVTVGLLSD